MAKANAKKRAEENKARIAPLFRVLVSAVVTFAAVRLGLYRASSRWWHYPLFVTTSGAAWFCYTSLAFIAAPSYDANGALVDGGADLTIGGMSSYYHDIVYVAVFLLVSTALVSDWFWLIGLVVRAGAVPALSRVVAFVCVCARVLRVLRVVEKGLLGVERSYRIHPLTGNGTR